MGEINLNLKEMANNFAKIRNQLGYTQQQIAAYLGVDRSMISKFEAGERSLGVSVIEKCCSLFGCELADLDGRNSGFEPMAAAFRSKELDMEDMKSVARIQSMILNLRKVKKL